MSLTVRQLTELRHLGTRFLAGESGGGRPALWAHTCELPEPWKWLGTGDLLLTDGYSFPADAKGQCAFLEQLHAANLAGMALAQGQLAAGLTREAADQADAMAFPVLETAYSVPFVSLARTVAESNSHESRRRLNAILRVYDVVRRGAAGDSTQTGLLSRLADEIGMSLHVVDLDAMVPVLTSDRPPANLVDVVCAQFATIEQTPAFTRVNLGGGTAFILPVSEPPRLVLAALPRSTDAPVDLVILQHVVAIASLEADRRAGLALRRRINGSRIFRQLVEGTLDPAAAELRVASHALGTGPWLVAALESSQDLDIDRVHARLSQASVAHLSLGTEPGLLLLLDNLDHRKLEEVARLVLAPSTGAAGRMGVSQQVRSLGRVPDAVREARWVLETDQPCSSLVARYGERAPLFMPSTLAQGEAVVAQVLGDMLAYDDANSGSLMTTLKAYFEANRSVQRCAESLNVHKQTVVYRIRRIEELTGRKMQDLSDLTTLFLAQRTWELLVADAMPPLTDGPGRSGRMLGDSAVVPLVAPLCPSTNRD